MLETFFNKLLGLAEPLPPGAARIEISLRDRSRPLLFLLAVGGASLLLAAETTLVGIASSFETPSGGRWLQALDSDDPWLDYGLGRAYKGTDPAESVRHLRRATELSPHARLYWDELASACKSRGDTQCFDRARERLLELCPMVPHYYLLAAQSYLQTNQLDAALAQFRRLLELDPTFAPATWSSLQTVQKPDLIFQKVLADSVDAKIKVGYAAFLSNQGDNDAAYRIWKLAVANPRPFPFTSASPYLERLIGLGRIEEAVSVWQDIERLGIVQRSKADEKDNLIFNCDFEQFPLNAGFDWRAGRIAYLAVDFSAPGAYRGAHCLRIDFTVSRNDEYEPVYQIVPVLPNHTYRLQAYVRSADITSDTGPHLRVSDTQQPSFRDALSETTVGTTPWHPVSLYFSTGPKTRAVRLSVWRPRARVFPTEISGSFWLDAVSMKSVTSDK
jgi:tetratricopeptide (TPR) repeat protein